MVGWGHPWIEQPKAMFYLNSLWNFKMLQCLQFKCIIIFIYLFLWINCVLFLPPLLYWCRFDTISWWDSCSWLLGLQWQPHWWQIYPAISEGKEKCHINPLKLTKTSSNVYILFMHSKKSDPLLFFVVYFVNISFLFCQSSKTRFKSINTHLQITKPIKIFNVNLNV